MFIITTALPEALLMLSALHVMAQAGMEGLTIAEEATEVFVALKDRKAEAVGIYAQAFPRLISKEYDDALEAAEKARVVFQELGGPSAAATVGSPLTSDMTYR